MPARFLAPLATHCPFGSFQFAGLGHPSESWPSVAPALASLAYIDWPVTVKENSTVTNINLCNNFIAISPLF